MLWNFRRIANHNNQLRKIPFVLLGSGYKELPFFLKHLHTIKDTEQFEYIALNTFNFPYKFVLEPVSNITKSKRFMIYAATKGFSTRQTATLLKLSVKSTHNRQQLLMRLIGIKNRYEFALISGQVLF